jgi:hypothetical protein
VSTGFRITDDYGRLRLFIIGLRYSRQTQNPPRATSWGFDPPSRHHLFSSLNHSLRVAWGHSNCTAEERLSSFRYKNGYAAYGGHFEWFRGIIVILWRPGRFVRFSYLRSITECAADNRSALADRGQPIPLILLGIVPAS